LELTCDLFIQVEKLMLTTAPPLTHPVYFEHREEEILHLRRECERHSHEYKAMLETSRGVKTSALITSSGSVRLVTPLEYHAMAIDAEKSLQGWKLFHAVYHVKPESCTCPFYRVNQFCKHQIAMKEFTATNMMASPLCSNSLALTPLRDITNTHHHDSFVSGFQYAGEPSPKRTRLSPHVKSPSRESFEGAITPTEPYLDYSTMRDVVSTAKKGDIFQMRFQMWNENFQRIEFCVLVSSQGKKKEATAEVFDEMGKPRGFEPLPDRNDIEERWYFVYELIPVTHQRMEAHISLKNMSTGNITK